MLRAKGPILKSILKYIKGNLGEEEFEALKAGLPEEVKEVLSRTILTSSFYDVDVIISIMEAFIQKKNLDPMKTYHDMGRVSADEGMKGIYRIFLKIGSPNMMIRQAPMVLKSYYSQGTMSAESVGKKEAHLKITDFGSDHPALCTRITGFIERTMELSGGKNVKLIHTKCGYRGDPDEEWIGTWD